MSCTSEAEKNFLNLHVLLEVDLVDAQLLREEVGAVDLAKRR